MMLQIVRSIEYTRAATYDHRKGKFRMSAHPATAKRRITGTVIVVCWIAFALFFASQNYLIQAQLGRPMEWKKTIVIWVVFACSWCALTPAILRIANRYPIERNKRRSAIVIHLLASALFSVLSMVIYILAEKAALGDNATKGFPFVSLWHLIVLKFHIGVLIYWVIIGIAHALEYYQRYQERELKASQLETRLAEAQLAALRTQLHPHFLFNTLNSIAVLMRKDVAAARRMLVQLSQLLRASLAKNAAPEISLQQELDFLERYLEIEQTRYQDRLAVHMQIDPAVREALVPQLILQPLVENALRHGIAEREANGKIEIRAERNNGWIKLQVRDNGPGMNAAIAEGVGLANTRARLENMYGSESILEMRNAAEGGLVVTVTLPFHAAE
jgi:two-component system LytT family sensor kinase